METLKAICYVVWIGVGVTSIGATTYAVTMDRKIAKKTLVRKDGV